MMPPWWFKPKNERRNKYPITIPKNDDLVPLLRVWPNFPRESLGNKDDEDSDPINLNNDPFQ